MRSERPSHLDSIKCKVKCGNWGSKNGGGGSGGDGRGVVGPRATGRPAAASSMSPPVEEASEGPFGLHVDIDE